MSAKPRLILFSGMGADGRLFGELRISGFELACPAHVMPDEGELLPAYARRVAEHHDVRSGDVVGGASFEGMLAAEIAATRAVRSLVLLGTAPHPRHLPPGVRAMERVSRLVPDSVLGLRAQRLLVRSRFGPMGRAHLELLMEMSRECPTLMMRRFAFMIAKWEGPRSTSCPTLVVHGARDRIIPLGRIPADRVLPEAGHAFQLTHARETSLAIEEFLAKAAVTREARE